MTLRQLTASLILAALSLPNLVRAEPGPASNASPPASAALPPAALPPAALPLTVELGDSQLDAAAIRRAVELELGRPVVLTPANASATQSLSVVVHHDHTVTVSYRAANGMLRTRSIATPRDNARTPEVIALLSGNLSRDEAAELLAALAARTAPTPLPEAPTKQSAESSPEAAATAPQMQPQKAEPSPPPAPKPAAQSTPTPLLTTPYPAFNLSLVPPLTLFRNSARRRINFELGLAFSHVGELSGAGLNLFALHSEGDVRGFSGATFYNRSDGTLFGFAASAIVNRNTRLRGAQVSGILNLDSGDAEGLFLAGIVNWAGDVQGAEFAGMLNRAERARGLQIAGVVNIAQRVDGLQIAVVNVAGQVHGVQLGVVNVAQHVDGTAIGLVSIADNVRIQPVFWVSSLQPVNLAMKFSIGAVYSQFGIGYGPGNATYTYELGLGAHLRFGRFFLEPGVHYSEMRSSKHPFDHELLEQGHYRLAAGLDLGKLSPFAGVGILQRYAHSGETPSTAPVEGFAGLALF